MKNNKPAPKGSNQYEDLELPMKWEPATPVDIFMACIIILAAVMLCVRAFT